MSTGKTALIWQCAVFLVLTTLLSATLFQAADHIPVAARLLTLATSALFCGLLLLPAVRAFHANRLAGQLLWSACVGTGSGLLMVIGAGSSLESLHVMLLSLGVLGWMLLLSSATELVAACHVPRTAAQRTILCLFTLALTAPLWLSPVAELQTTVSPDTVVALSPASHLAALVEYDYLRSAWFYSHTPLGGLRYDYPAPVTSIVACFATSLVLFLAAHIIRTRQAQRPKPACTPLTHVNKELTL